MNGVGWGLVIHAWRGDKAHVGEELVEAVQVPIDGYRKHLENTMACNFVVLFFTVLSLLISYSMS